MKHKLYNRILASLALVFILIVILWIFATIIVFFRTGAEKYEFEAVSDSFYKNHTPNVTIQSSSEIYNGQFSVRIMEQVKKAYLKSWRAYNYSLQHNTFYLLNDHFSEGLSQTIRNNIERNIKTRSHVIQVDAEHNLNFHLISTDQQFVSFTDENVPVYKYVYLNENHLILDTTSTVDIEVLMLLDEGYWKIFKWVQTESDKNNYKPAKEDEKYFRVNGREIKEGIQSFVSKGVNYYPAENPWFEMWLNFDKKTIDKDFNLIQSYGLNTVRIFIPYDVFGGPDVDEKRLLQLDTVMQLAEKHNLKLIPTLFDFIPDYSVMSYTNADKHLRTVVKRYRGNNIILAWDIKNEPDLDFDLHSRTKVLQWLNFIADRIKAYDPHHLITIGWSDATYAHHLKDDVDIVSFHFYKPKDQLKNTIHSLKKEVGDKVLYLQEFGLSTFTWPLVSNKRAERKQRDLFKHVFETTTEENINFAFWTMYDFHHAPSYVFGNLPWRRWPQTKFGIIDEKGKEKRAVQLFDNTGPPSKN